LLPLLLSLLWHQTVINKDVAAARRRATIGVHLSVESGVGLLTMDRQMENLLSHNSRQCLTTHRWLLLVPLHKELTELVVNLLPACGRREDHGSLSGIILETAGHTKGTNLVDDSGGDATRRRVGVMRVKGSRVEDERHTTMLLDGLGEVRTRGSPMLGKFEEMTAAKSTLTLVIVHGGNQTGLLGWGEMVGLHSFVRLAVVFPLLLLLGLGTLFDLLEFFLFGFPIGSKPPGLFHTSQTKLQTSSHLLLLFSLPRARHRMRVHGFVIAIGVGIRVVSRFLRFVFVQRNTTKVRLELWGDTSELRLAQRNQRLGWLRLLRLGSR